MHAREVLRIQGHFGAMERHAATLLTAEMDALADTMGL